MRGLLTGCACYSRKTLSCVSTNMRRSWRSKVGARRRAANRFLRACWLSRTIRLMRPCASSRVCISAEDVLSREQTHYPLTIVAFPGPQLTFKVNYDFTCFDARAITAMLDHLSTLLSGIATSPGALLSELPLLGASEQAELLQSGAGRGRSRIRRAPGPSCGTLRGASRAEPGRGGGDLRGRAADLWRAECQGQSAGASSAWSRSWRRDGRVAFASSVRSIW